MDHLHLMMCHCQQGYDFIYSWGILLGLITLQCPDMSTSFFFVNSCLRGDYRPAIYNAFNSWLNGGVMPWLWQMPRRDLTRAFTVQERRCSFVTYQWTEIQSTVHDDGAEHGFGRDVMALWPSTWLCLKLEYIDSRCFYITETPSKK